MLGIRLEYYFLFHNAKLKYPRFYMSYIFPHNVYKLKGFLDSPNLIACFFARKSI